MELRQTSRKKSYLYILIALIIILVALTVRGGEKPLILMIKNKNEIINDRFYPVIGETNASIVKIKINNKEVAKIYPIKNKIEYVVDTEDLTEGWNYFDLTGYRSFKKDTTRTGFAVNIIDKQPDVFLPDLNLFDARINGNKAYHKSVLNYNVNGEAYDWKNVYFQCFPLKESDLICFDINGIPKAKYEEWEYNPVTIAQHGLGLYNSFMKTGDEALKKHFLDLVDWLIENQQDNGSYPYDFSFKLKHNLELSKGFVSGMAQGQVLSCLARAFYISPNEKYLEAGYRALQFMITSGEFDNQEGCSKTLKDFVKNNQELEEYIDCVIVEEYVSNPSSYVLNGDLFAAIGLYDWYQVTLNYKEYGNQDAKKAFENVIHAIGILLPYYDYYGWSSYDLLQYTYESSPYFTSAYAHDCHIYLLDALYDITGEQKIKKYRDIFLDYNNDEFWRQTNILYYDKRN